MLILTYSSFFVFIIFSILSYVPSCVNILSSYVKSFIFFIPSTIQLSIRNKMPTLIKALMLVEFLQLVQPSFVNSSMSTFLQNQIPGLSVLGAMLVTISTILSIRLSTPRKSNCLTPKKLFLE